ncbi:MAG: GAF domain-containing protein, partial [Candidatus Limnocylindria bacterium]
VGRTVAEHRAGGPLVKDSRPRVAVLDDDDEFVAMMEVLLTEEGFDFVRAPLGPDVVNWLGASGPDVAVVDLRGVSEGGGLEIVRRIRADPRLAAMPVLVCSADIDLLRARAADLAAVRHVASLEKPFRIDAVIGALGRLLSGAAAAPVARGRPDPGAVASLAATLERIGRSLRWAVTDAWVPDTRPGMMRCAAAWASTPELEPFARLSRRIRLPYGGGLPGRVWASGRPTWAEDLAGDMNFPRLPTAERVGLVSAAAVPVMDGDEIAGVVAGYATRARKRDAAALDLLREAASESVEQLRAAAGAARR